MSQSCLHVEWQERFLGLEGSDRLGGLTPCWQRIPHIINGHNELTLGCR